LAEMPSDGDTASAPKRRGRPRKTATEPTGDSTGA
jgi:hypothetical protein